MECQWIELLHLCAFLHPPFTPSRQIALSLLSTVLLFPAQCALCFATYTFFFSPFQVYWPEASRRLKWPILTIFMSTDKFIISLDWHCLDTLSHEGLQTQVCALQGFPSVSLICYQENWSISFDKGEGKELFFALITHYYFLSFNFLNERKNYT